MMAVHEFGHVLGAWYTGGTVRKVVLHPLTISRTDLVHNPDPLVVAWAGPLLGELLPLMVFAVTAALRRPGAISVGSVAAGLLLWHRLGPHFGLGKAGKPVNPWAAYLCPIVLLVVVVAELLVDAE